MQYIKRIIFTKKGDIRFISHLDMIGTFTRCLRRTNLSVQLTQGFNPHYKIVFSNPTSLGVESYCELADLVFTEKYSNNQIKETLNKFLPPEMQIIKVEDITKKDPTIHEICQQITYEADLDISKQKCENRIENLKKNGLKIEIVKKNKKIVYNLESSMEQARLSHGETVIGKGHAPSGDQDFKGLNVGTLYCNVSLMVSTLEGLTTISFTIFANKNGKTISSYVFIKNFVGMKEGKELEVPIRKVLL